MAGRRPKPSELKKLQGNPGKRPLNKLEPKVSSLAIPECPEELSDDAKKEWHRIAPSLQAIGVLVNIDVAALAAYCQAWSRWLDAEKNLRKTGAVLKTAKGYPIMNPYLSIANTAMDQMRKFMVEFGMTPSSRSRIQIAPPVKEKSALESILDGDEEGISVH